MISLISILLSIAFELMEHSFSFSTFLLDKYDLFIEQAVVIVQDCVIFLCVFHSYEVFNKFEVSGYKMLGNYIVAIVCSMSMSFFNVNK